MERPPIDSEAVFRRILDVSDSLHCFNMPNSVVINSLQEPLGVYVPNVLTPEEAVHHAEAIAASERAAKEAAARNEQLEEPPALVRQLANHYPIHPQSGAPYPPRARLAIDAVMLALRGPDHPERQTAVDYTPTEVGRGDKYPHIDYMAIGNAATKPHINNAPNIWFGLGERKALARLGQMRHASWIEALRDGIAEARYPAITGQRMTPYDINRNMTTEWILRNNDPRVPERLKEGVRYLEEALRYPTPWVQLNPGDVFIFQGHQHNDVLPAVHHFLTVPEKSKEHIPRSFAVFSPRLVNSSEVNEEQAFTVMLQGMAEGIFQGRPNRLAVDVLRQHLHPA